MLRIAHRGASGYEPENTLVAFERAMDLRADMIELDVRLSKDGFVVVIHDKKVDRVTDGTGKVSTLTLEELKHLDTGSGQTLYTLEEILKKVNGKVKVNIDLKEDRAVDKTVELIEKFVKEKVFTFDDFLISAFKPTILWKIRKRNSKIPVTFNFVAFPPFFLILSKIMGLRYIKPQKRLVTPEFSYISHSMGFLILVWTINTKEDAKKMSAYHVDGIITDYPDILF